MRPTVKADVWPYQCSCANRDITCVYENGIEIDETVWANMHISTIVYADRRLYPRVSEELRFVSGGVGQFGRQGSRVLDYGAPEGDEFPTR